jgi:hypothetical protein
MYWNNEEIVLAKSRTTVFAKIFENSHLRSKMEVLTRIDLNN